MPTDFEHEGAPDREAVEVRCGELVDELASHHAGVHEAIRYSLLGGGKRLRPLLCLWTHDSLGGESRDAALDAACALECVHTYSLIHDDLPCMDDDDLRRGKPSSHVKFGEANAVLAGDALLTLAFEILSTMPERRGVDTGLALECVRVLASAAGTGGLITGQALDLDPGPEAAGEAIDVVARIHENKTARLIAASMEMGAIIAGAHPGERERVGQAGLAAGRAFQVIDDLLDLESDKETLGKTPGKDVKSGKLTYPAVLGVPEARREAARLSGLALGLLPGDPHGPLARLVARLVDRRS